MNYPELLKHIMQKGKVVDPRGREVCEFMKTRLIVDPEANIFAFPKARPIEKLEAYLWQELAWYMSGDRHSKHIAKFASLWDKIKNPDGTLNSNYGHLVFYQRTPHPSLGLVTCTPFQWAVKALKMDPFCRQAVITYNNGGYNFEGNDDYICTQHQAFFIRDNVLLCYVALRSSDAIFGLPYNMPWWSLVHQQLWHALRPYYPNLIVGKIEVDIYSAHVYKQHYGLVERMLQENFEIYKLSVDRMIPTTGPHDLDWYRNHIKDFVKIKPSRLEVL